MASTSSGKPTRLPSHSDSELKEKSQIMPLPMEDQPNLHEIPIDSESVPSSLAAIIPILRVANEIQKENPRVAFLCRHHATEKAHTMDPTSSGRGVRQFKTHLLHRLDREDDKIKCTLSTNDPEEIQLFYQQFYEENIKDAEHRKKPEEMANIFQTATVLYEVLKTVVPSRELEEKTERYAKDVEGKKKRSKHFNILPLFAIGVKPIIMEFPEINAAFQALRNVDNLPKPRILSTQGVPDDSSVMSTDSVTSVNDILDWLSSIFGFQKGNVENQREHLILLLANMYIRSEQSDHRELDSATVQKLQDEIFKNYTSWCNYLRCETNLKFPRGCDTKQLELIYIGLYLLIWGEASNVRLMPECLCYIFHNVYGILNSNVHPVSGGDTYEAADHDEESFLKEVISPIYQVLLKEVKRSKGGKASHSRWRNYDDLNEYFWSDRCFRLGWPMDPKADFFRHSEDVIQPATERDNQATAGKTKPETNFVEDQTKPKTNFVEVRTFLHLYRSFNRMWIFFILSFQVMLIIAWSPSRSLAAFFDANIFRRVLSIFVTYSFLNFLQATLDIILAWNTWKNLTFNQILRNILKFAVALVWAVVLPIGYFSSLQNSTTGFAKFFSSLAWDWMNRSFYNYAVLLYLIPNSVSVVLLCLPPLRRCIERSNRISFLMWWAQPKTFVGRGMDADIFSLLKYTAFWIMVLICKLAFSFYVEILPLVGPTKLIMETPIDKLQWHELFPNGTYNVGIVIAIWAPIVLVYFMDVQIWFAIFSTLFGAIYGAFSRLGEIRTLGMLRFKFQAVPLGFNRCLLPLAKKDLDSKIKASNFVGPPQLLRQKNLLHWKTIAEFSQVWNEFIYSMRMEDLISNRDRDLLLVPYSSGVSVVQWPPFLLASKIPIALDMAKDFKGKDDDYLFRKITSDDYMHSAVIECYETLRDIIYALLEDESDRMILRNICYEVEQSIEQNRFINRFKMSELPQLSEKLKKFLKFLLAERDYFSEPLIINALQNIMEIIMQDIMVDGLKILEGAHHAQYGKIEQRFERLAFQLTLNKSWKEKVVRLHLLLTVKESAIDVPQNLEARRRITFFANSLFMNMPKAPKVQNMLSFSVLTPYFKEDVLYSEDELKKENKDGISTLFYLQKIYPDEWTNFLERIKDVIKESKEENREKEKMDFIRHWVSYRGQTLARTVRGMMYYKQALELQCFLEFADDEAIFDGYRNFEIFEDHKVFKDRAQALANLKFTYVVSCQVYGNQKKSDDARDRSCYINILNLMLTYPSLRVAYIDEREEKINGKSQKLYYSVLVKGGEKLDEEIYRIKLPGSPIDIGEGTPENQNHAIIFTRGEALQTIDMNQDNYFEEAFKMRNVLEEFLQPQHSQRKPTILGLREHIFTGSFSSLAQFVSNQETSVVTIGQRILANPLRVRFHYGHSDIFDKIFHITRGGISKASKGINLIENIFAGFNSTLRGGFITHHEYIQVGKGRDVGMNQLTLFEAKLANGNGEQTLSRDVYRLGHQFDFYRMLSFYFTTVGSYFSSMLAVLTVYAFLYGRMYLVLSGMEKEILKNRSIQQSKALEEASATQSIFQFGLWMMLPMIMEIDLEKGFRTALSDFMIMQLQLVSVFFTFQLGTKAHYFGRAILHGSSKYRATGQGFFVFHTRFADNYMLYSRSHFVKALELFILMIIYEAYRQSSHTSDLDRFISFSMWFLVASWLFAPFVFNPYGFEWQKTVDDWTNWKTWMGNRGGVGIPPDKSWESWWDEEHEHLRYTNIRGRVLEIILAFRFFVYQYGIVYNLHIAHHSKSFMVYGLSWLVMVTAFLVVMTLPMVRRRVDTNIQVLFRILKALLFLGLMSIITVLFVIRRLTISDLFAAILAVFPTGWALLLVGQACGPLLKMIGLWDSLMELARAYDYIMGLVIFMPLTIFSWFPFVSEFQTRMFYNQAFSRGVQISMILAGKDKIKIN
ncbi:hypothetical protein ACJW30_06G231200 [Castanea mollissima]